MIKRFNKKYSFLCIDKNNIDKVTKFLSDNNIDYIENYDIDTKIIDILIDEYNLKFSDDYPDVDYEFFVELSNIIKNPEVYFVSKENTIESVLERYLKYRYIRK